MPYKDPADRAAYARRHRQENAEEYREYHRQWLAEWRSRFARTGEVPSHNRTGYSVGCRCRVCRAAAADYRRERAAAKATEPEFNWEDDA